MPKILMFKNKTAGNYAMGDFSHRKNGSRDVKLTYICLNKIKLLKLKEHFLLQSILEPWTYV